MTLSINDSIITLCNYDECHHAECHYAECHYAECPYAEWPYAECLNVVMLSVVILNVVIPSVLAPCLRSYSLTDAASILVGDGVYWTDTPISSGHPLNGLQVIRSHPARPPLRGIRASCQTVKRPDPYIIKTYYGRNLPCP
jgi:hypothetical protein